jgi:hypothetical protein
MKLKQIECFETSAYKIQTPGNHREENIQHTEHGESLKSKINLYSDELLINVLALRAKLMSVRIRYIGILYGGCAPMSVRISRYLPNCE